MRRRALLAAVGIVLAARAEAQTQGQGPARLVWIGAASLAAEAPRVASVRAGLADNGLLDGRDYVLEVLTADGDYRRFPALVQQAIALGPAILLVSTILMVRAAQQATKTIPIVFTATNDPVGAGLIDSLARPGGNTTGIATLNEQTSPKLIEMMQAVLPAARRVAVLVNPANPTNRPMFDSLRAAAQGAGIEVTATEVAGPDAIGTVLPPPTAPQPDVVIVLLDAMLVFLNARIAQLCLDRRIALLGPSREQTDAGGLLSYGPSLDVLIRRSAYYAKRILAGAQPRDLPVEQPVKFELAVNLRTAKALGIVIPPAVLAIADDTIE